MSDLSIIYFSKPLEKVTVEDIRKLIKNKVIEDFKLDGKYHMINICKYVQKAT